VGIYWGQAKAVSVHALFSYPGRFKPCQRVLR